MVAGQSDVESCITVESNASSISTLDRVRRAGILKTPQIISLIVWISETTLVRRFGHRCTITDITMAVCRCRIDII